MAWTRKYGLGKLNSSAHFAARLVDVMTDRVGEFNDEWKRSEGLIRLTLWKTYYYERTWRKNILAKLSPEGIGQPMRVIIWRQESPCPI
jgi:hypothetical protein